MENTELARLAVAALFASGGYCLGITAPRWALPVKARSRRLVSAAGLFFVGAAYMIAKAIAG